VNLLLLQPTTNDFGYSLYLRDKQKLTLDAKLDNFAGMASEKGEWISSLIQINRHCQQVKPDRPVEEIVIRVLFGGDVFARPAIVDSEVIKKLESIVQQAPLHLPGTLQLISCCNGVFPGVPIILVFETSFFSGTPDRERAYAISPALTEGINIRRYGYNGIYHEAACSQADRQLRKELNNSSSRTISICLENQPEVAAVKSRRVLMVTKAIPGETMCGQIDPNIVLTLSETVDWGPERINAVLTKESGLLGLTGKAVTLEDVFTQNKPDFLLARQICQYRLLNICGAAIAAMGGIDAIVFSGRFVNLGDILGPYLTRKLTSVLVPQANQIRFSSLKEPKAISIVKAAAKTIYSFQMKMSG